jgi:subtilisin family serine protease
MAGPPLLTAPRLYVAAVVGKLAAGDAAAGVDAMVRAIGWLGASNVRLVNVSLAGPYNKILDLAVQRAAARGMLFVAATGNEGAASPPRYPAAFRDVIAVTAVDAARRLYRNAVQGSHVDVAAPGVDIFIPVDNGYKSGTSYAAPYVTAYFAARAGALPKAVDARKILARHVQDLGAPGRDSAFGMGLLDASDACGVKAP